MKLRTMALLGAALALAGLYASPYLAVREMRDAAQQQDAARLAGQVDFPALRASLKQGVQARLAGQERRADGQPTMASAMGAAVAGALLGPMVDSLITPESLSRILQGQRPAAAVAGGLGGGVPPEEVRTRMAYESPGRFVLSIRRAGADEEPVELVLHRDGLLSWKLAELRLP